MWPTCGCISYRTVIRRLYSSRRPLKWPELTRRRRQTRLQPAGPYRHWNLRSWRRIYWSDESRFLFKPIDGRICVLQRWMKTMFLKQKPWCYRMGCFSNDFKTPFQITYSTFSSLKYCDDILDGHVKPYFDSHVPADWPLTFGGL